MPIAIIKINITAIEIIKINDFGYAIAKTNANTNIQNPLPPVIRFLLMFF